DSAWHKTYEGPSGGVITVASGYGELNHLLATGAMFFVADLRSSILDQPREKHAELLLARKDEVIARLNSDFCRPWFGRKADGRVVDLEDMTYADVISRLVELMYVKHQQRWIHESYYRLVLDFVARAERRLGVDLPEMSIVPELQLAHPPELEQSFTARYPAAESELLHSEDIQYFVAICKRHGQKPVPFIPVLDSDFSVMFLKDIGWQSEDLDAVVGQDPQRVAIQQGPVATHYSTIVNEPVKDILDGVYHGHVTALLSRDYDGDAANVPVVEYVGAQPRAIGLPANIGVQVTDSMRTYQLPDSQDQLPELGVWLDALAGPSNSWLHALLTAPVIVAGSSYVDNYVQRALRPRPGQAVTIRMDDNQPLSLEVVDDSGVLRLKIERHSNGIIELNIYHTTPGGVISLCHMFTYRPQQMLSPIRLAIEGHAERMHQLYIGIWVNNADVPTGIADVIDSNCRLFSDEFVVTKGHIRAFCQNIGNR
ncbi:fatty acid synthase alpha subunit Lsd1, partial [Coemansia sp. RSA 2052]